MKLLRTALSVAACLLSAHAIVRAQLNMFPVQEGMSDASQHAEESFAADARLILVGALGDTTVSGAGGPVELRIDLTTGMANAWAYAFYSSSLDSIATYVVVDIPMMGRQVFDGFLPASPPPGTESGVDTSAPFLPSDRMVARLKEDTTFARYRTDIPFRQPHLIGIRQLTAAETSTLPATFGTGSPTWHVEFDGGRDTSMRCYVSALTGETYCVRGTAAAAVEETRDDATSTGAGCVSLGEGRFLLTARSLDRPTMALYTVDGSRVDLELMPRREGEIWTARMDLAALPAGAYFCRIEGRGWSRTFPLAR